MVASAVAVARALTSSATTANPRPASPARAASMVALRASKLVCFAILLIVALTRPICSLLSLSLPTAVSAPAAISSAFCAILVASLAFLEISRMEIDTSPVAEANWSTLPVTPPLASVTLCASAAVVREESRIWRETALSSLEAPANVWVDSSTSLSVEQTLSKAVFSALPKRAVSSFPTFCRRGVKLPSATCSKAPTATLNGLAMPPANQLATTQTATIETPPKIRKNSRSARGPAMASLEGSRINRLHPCPLYA